MSRMMMIAGFILAAALGAGSVIAYNILLPRPAPRVTPAWQVFPMAAQVPVDTCKDGFTRAFRAAGFTNILPSPPTALHVQAADAGYSVTGICMPRREAAAVVIAGVDPVVVDARLNTISTAVLGRAR